MNKTARTVIIDYGSGNLRSVLQALIFRGIDAVVTSDPSLIAENDTILIPGVSAFSSAMENLNRLGFSEKIRGCAARKQRIIGICAGMQVLFEEGYEFGITPGLGLLPGCCESLGKFAVPAEKYKVPVIGWKNVVKTKSAENALSVSQVRLLTGYKYFAHSFYVKPECQSDCIATTDFAGEKIPVAVKRENIFGFQFHPEKSAEKGLMLLYACIANSQLD